MGTTANLELRMGGIAIYASCTHDGYRVYESVPRFAKFLDGNREPGYVALRQWFDSTSKSILPNEYSDGRTGGCPCEVIIDTERKLVLHTGDSSEGGDLEIVSKDFPEEFKRACTALRRRHNYQVFNYEQAGLRKIKKEAARIAKKTRAGSA